MACDFPRDTGADRGGSLWLSVAPVHRALSLGQPSVSLYGERESERE